MLHEKPPTGIMKEKSSLSPVSRPRPQSNVVVAHRVPFRGFVSRENELPSVVLETDTGQPDSIRSQIYYT